MHNLRTDGARLWDSLMRTAEIGATAKGGICRLTLTEHDRKVRAFGSALREARNFAVQCLVQRVFGKAFGQEVPHGTPGILQRFPRDVARSRQVFQRSRRVLLQRLLERLELEDDGREALRNRVVDFARKAVALLDDGKVAGLLEEVRVLDRDPQLVAERFRSEPVGVAECRRFWAPDVQHPDHKVPAPDRHCELASRGDIEWVRGLLR